MTIENQTPFVLIISGRKVAPKTVTILPELCYQTLEIKTQSSRVCKVITKDSIRSFENSANLAAMEGERKDDKGMKRIIVYIP